jgi:ADP-ribosylglycohydrolase
VPAGQVHDGVRVARDLAHVPSAATAARALGNGSRTSAPDALWAAVRHLGDYEEAIWTTASAGGDVDTTCAIAGGVVGAHVGVAALPSSWWATCEPLPGWAT